MLHRALNINSKNLAFAFLPIKIKLRACRLFLANLSVPHLCRTFVW